MENDDIGSVSHYRLLLILGQRSSRSDSDKKFWRAGLCGHNLSRHTSCLTRYKHCGLDVITRGLFCQRKKKDNALDHETQVVCSKGYDDDYIEFRGRRPYNQMNVVQYSRVESEVNCEK